MIPKIELEKRGRQILEFYNSPSEQVLRAYREAYLSLHQKNLKVVSEEITNCLNVVEVSNKKYGNNEKHIKSREKYLAHFSLFVYMKLLYVDISVLYNAYCKSDDVTEKQVLAKSIALNLYVVFSDVPEFLGKKMNRVVEERANQNRLSEDQKISLEEDLKSIRAFLNSAKELSFGYLREIRNNVTAHKDKNVIQQITVLKKIDHFKIEVLCLAAVNLFQRLIFLEREYFVST